MNIITQEAKKKQAVVKFAKKNGKSAARRMYGVSLFKRVIKLQRSFAKLRGGHSAVLLENAAKIQHILIAYQLRNIRYRKICGCEQIARTLHTHICQVFLR